MTKQPKNDWLSQLNARQREHWLLKAIGITTAIAAFMVVYFALLNHPQYPPTTMPLLPPDYWVGFVPWAVWPYASLWLYIGIVPALLTLRGEMGRYVFAVTLLAVIGCSIFYFWPTTVPEFAIDWARWPALNLIKSNDAAGNACPSLHVAFAVLTAIWLQWLLHAIEAPFWVKAVNVVWCLLIVWSTMAVHQHVALDVGAGALLGVCVALACLYLRPSSDARAFTSQTLS